MNYLIDTNVLSETGKRDPDPRVIEWLGDIGVFALSAISLDEIYFGLALKSHSHFERTLDRYLRTFCTVHVVTDVIAKHAGLLRGQLASKGKVRTQADVLIAATAAAHGLTLATRNERDFADCGVAIHNPFRA
jgi:toxin FitB